MFCTIFQEYYENGTEPKKNCTCHAKYRFCKTSGKLASELCPEEGWEEKVVLVKKETAKTEDSALLLEHFSDGSLCDLHH